MFIAPQRVQSLRESLRRVVFPVLIDGSEIPVNLPHPVVEHKQFAVRNLPEKGAYPLLRSPVEREMRCDDIVVEIVEVFVDEIFEHIDILLMQAYGDFRMVIEPLQH